MGRRLTPAEVLHPILTATGNLFAAGTSITQAGIVFPDGT